MERVCAHMSHGNRDRIIGPVDSGAGAPARGGHIRYILGEPCPDPRGDPRTRYMGGGPGSPPLISRTEYLEFDIPGRRAFVNITPEIERVVRRSGVREGLCLANAMHISASVFINDDEPGLHADYERWLEGLAPHEPVSAYEHNRTGEDNADAHLKRQVMGREVVMAVTGGRLDFGPWEQVFYGEFDGGRKKRVLVKVIGA